MTPEERKNIMRLKEITSVNLKSCQDAYHTANGNMEEALEIIAKQNKIRAEKHLLNVDKSQVGMLFAMEHKDKIISFAAYSITDFVMRNSLFQDSMAQVLSRIIEISDKGIMDINLEKDEKFQILISDLISKVCEPVRVSDVKVHVPKKGKLYFYMHNTMTKILGTGSMGKTLSIVETLGDNPSASMDVCLHVVALHPLFLSMEQCDSALIEKTREQLRESLKGKSHEMIESILPNQVKKTLEEYCLLEQKFVRDNNITVAEYAKRNSIEIVNFYYNSM